MVYVPKWTGWCPAFQVIVRTEFISTPWLWTRQPRVALWFPHPFMCSPSHGVLVSCPELRLEMEEVCIERVTPPPNSTHAGWSLGSPRGREDSWLGEPSEGSRCRLDHEKASAQTSSDLSEATQWRSHNPTPGSRHWQEVLKGQRG